jgi:3-deoxy-D-manno-octulosonate 8-phosphate phosphatase (KDO 8-P phosphatase)
MAIRWLVLDVDGVLTDGRLYYGDDGQVLRAFHIRDGSAIVLAPRAGLSIAVVSGRADPAVRRRMAELGVPEVHLGVTHKVAVLRDLAARYGVSLAEIAFMGDDVQDLPAFEVVGYRMTVPDAPPEVRVRADWVSPVPGGQGAVRAAIEHLLAQRGVRLVDVAWQVLQAEDPVSGDG